MDAIKINLSHVETNWKSSCVRYLPQAHSLETPSGQLGNKLVVVFFFGAAAEGRLLPPREPLVVQHYPVARIHYYLIPPSRGGGGGSGRMWLFERLHVCVCVIYSSQIRHIHTEPHTEQIQLEPKSHWFMLIIIFTWCLNYFFGLLKCHSEK